MTDRPEVLHVLEALTAGTARQLTDLVRTASTVHHRVVVPSERFGDNTDTEATSAMAAAGAEVIVVDMRRMPPHVDNARALWDLRRLMRRQRPAIVHGHGSIGGALSRVAAYTSGRIPAVWTPHGVITSRPVLLAERAFNAITTRTVAVSPSEAALLCRLKLSRPDKVTVIRNGLAATPVGVNIDLRQQLGIPDDAPIVGTVGRLSGEKCPLEFVATARRVSQLHPEAHFVLIGDGPMAAQVDAAIAAASLGTKLHRLEYLPNAADAVAGFDVFLFLSAREGGPYAPLEAIREGVPVVLSDVVGNRDVIEDGVSGYLVQLHDTEAAARRVSELISSAELRHTIATAASERLRTVFDVDTMGRAYDALYAELIPN